MRNITRMLQLLASILAIASLPATHGAAAESRLATIKSEKEIGIGWAEWRPMEYKDIASGDLQGVLVAMAKEIAARLGAKPTFVQDNWSTLTAGIAANKFQISMMGMSEGRARVVDFSTPLYHVPFKVIVSSGSDFKTFDDVNKPENTIAVTTGSTTDEILTQLEHTGKIKAQITRLKDVGGAILSLTSNKVTAFASSTDDLVQIIDKQPALKLVDGDFGASIFSVAVPKGDADLKSAVDNIVTSMVSDGTVDKLLKQYQVSGTVAGAK
jgi:ABC-type amino acid transport substrate-binding protein